MLCGHGYGHRSIVIVVDKQNLAVAVEASVDVEAWREQFDTGFAWIAGRFGRAQPRLNAPDDRPALGESSQFAGATGPMTRPRRLPSPAGEEPHRLLVIPIYDNGHPYLRQHPGGRFELDDSQGNHPAEATCRSTFQEDDPCARSRVVESHRGQAPARVRGG